MITKYFRTVGWAEGISLLLLFGVAMPIKYIGGVPEPTKIIGAIHGILFLLYNYLALQLKEDESWPDRKFVAAVVLSCLPFGTFIFESRFRSAA